MRVYAYMSGILTGETNVPRFGFVNIKEIY